MQTKTTWYDLEEFSKARTALFNLETKVNAAKADEKEKRDQLKILSIANTILGADVFKIQRDIIAVETEKNRKSSLGPAVSEAIKKRNEIYNWILEVANNEGIGKEFLQGCDERLKIYAENLEIYSKNLIEGNLASLHLFQQSSEKKCDFISAPFAGSNSDFYESVKKNMGEIKDRKNIVDYLKKFKKSFNAKNAPRTFQSYLLASDNLLFEALITKKGIKTDEFQKAVERDRIFIALLKHAFNASPNNNPRTRNEKEREQNSANLVALTEEDQKILNHFLSECRKILTQTSEPPAGNLSPLEELKKLATCYENAKTDSEVGTKTKQNFSIDQYDSESVRTLFEVIEGLISKPIKISMLTAKVDESRNEAIGQELGNRLSSLGVQLKLLAKQIPNVANDPDYLNVLKFIHELAAQYKNICSLAKIEQKISDAENRVHTNYTKNGGHLFVEILNKISALNHQLKHLQGLKEANDGAIAGLESTVDGLRIQLETITQENNIYNGQVKELIAQLSQANQTATDLHNDLQQSKQEIQQLKSQAQVENVPALEPKKTNWKKIAKYAIFAGVGVLSVGLILTGVGSLVGLIGLGVLATYGTLAVGGGLLVADTALTVLEKSDGPKLTTVKLFKSLDVDPEHKKEFEQQSSSKDISEISSREYIGSYQVPAEVKDAPKDAPLVVAP